MTAKVRPETLKSKLMRLACMIADGALEPEVSFDSRMEALKYLTGFYAADVRARARDGRGDTDDSPNFEKFRQNIMEAEAE